MAAQFCDYIKIVHFNWVDFMVCELHLNKTLKR